MKIFEPMLDVILRKGYLPEGIPPVFHSEKIADYFIKNPNNDFFTNNKTKPVRSAYYNASKRGLARRVFSVMHPITAHDSAKFIEQNWYKIEEYIRKSEFSLSSPIFSRNLKRAFLITPHHELEKI